MAGVFQLNKKLFAFCKSRPLYFKILAKRKYFSSITCIDNENLSKCFIICHLTWIQSTVKWRNCIKVDFYSAFCLFWIPMMKLSVLLFSYFGLLSLVTCASMGKCKSKDARLKGGGGNFQGDINLSTVPRNGLLSKKYLWPKKDGIVIVYYYFGYDWSKFQC